MNLILICYHSSSTSSSSSSSSSSSRNLEESHSPFTVQVYFWFVKCLYRGKSQRKPSVRIVSAPVDFQNRWLQNEGPRSYHWANLPHWFVWFIHWSVSHDSAHHTTSSILVLLFILHWSEVCLGVVTSYLTQSDRRGQFINCSSIDLVWFPVLWMVRKLSGQLNMDLYSYQRQQDIKRRIFANWMALLTL
jgi:hypothetical protein